MSNPDAVTRHAMAVAKQELQAAKEMEEANPYNPWVRDLVVRKSRALRMLEGKGRRLLVVEGGDL